MTYSVAIADKRLQVAASVVGSPQWRLPWPESPHLHLDSFFPTALLSQAAGKDGDVLLAFARELQQRLGPYYAQALSGCAISSIQTLLMFSRRKIGNKHGTWWQLGFLPIYERPVRF